MVKNHRLVLTDTEQIATITNKQNLAFFNAKQVNEGGVHLVVEVAIRDQQEAAVVALDQEVVDLVNNFKRKESCSKI